jgi:flavin reductase (DIM6/NTAB) family NADH-FMN oxidoreductase RutF
MTDTLIEIRPEEIADNPFKLIGRDWMLIAAGSLASFNMMTASWGALGELWGQRVAFCFVRPHRYTFQFMERATHYTLNFFDETYRTALDYCGSHSGRDVNKAQATGLTPVAGTGGAVYFAQARLVLECRKLYAQDLAPDCFVDPTIGPRNYPQRDYHRMYVGEIVRCLARS